MARGPDLLRRRTLRGSILGFLVLTVGAGIGLPPFLSGGDYLADPAFWAAIVGAPVFVVLWQQAARRPPESIARWFVATAMAEAWVFTVLIQGSGYLVGNYAYLTVIVLLASFFLSARATAAYAAANLLGVIVVSSVWGLALSELLLSIVYIVLFSGMLILIATTFESDAWALQRSNGQLAQMQAHQQQLLDATHDSIIVTDHRGRIRSINDRAQEIIRGTLGTEAKLGDSLQQLLTPRMQEVMHDMLFEVAKQGEAVVDEVFETPTGTFAFRSRMCMLPDRSGIVIISTDTTEQHLRIEQERARILREAEVEKLRGLHELQRNFINVASHELQTPLTPLRLQARLLRERAKAGASPGDLRAIEVIERNTERMASLVDDILEVVRIGSGRLPIEKHRADVAALVRQSVEDHRPAAIERGVQLTADAPEHLWAVLDAHRVEQILNNLVRNALRFTSEGGHVAVSARPDGPRHLALRIRDDGIGMEPDQIGRLFQPFVQLHEDVMPRTGTGLGLAICKGLAEAHGGTITAHSEGPGQGATFTVRLPTQTVRPSRPGPVEHLPAEAPPTPTGR